MKIKIPILLLCLMMSACRTSSGVAESSAYHFKWYVDEFWSGGVTFEEVDAIADDHCRRHKKRAVWSPDFSPRSMLKYLNYTCVPEEQYRCKLQLWGSGGCEVKAKPRPISSAEDHLSLEAEKKCIDLGFRQDTAKFVECVHQISK
jgi:hypothetical protein